MRRFFVKNLLFIIAVNLLVKPVWVFMIDRNVQNTVGHDAYGTYQALLNICIIFQVLLDFGLTNYNTNLISQKPDKLKTLFAPLLTTRLLLALAYSVIVFLFGLLAGYKTVELTLLTGVLTIQGISSFVQYLRSNISSLHKFRIDGVLSVMDRLLMIAICGFLLFSPATSASFTIEWFVLAQIACYGITALTGFIVIYKITGVAPGLTFKTLELFHTIKSSFPYAIMIFLMGIHMRSDMVLVERLASKDEAGIYASTFRLLDISNMFGIMFAGVLLPMFGRMIAGKQSVQPLIQLSVNLLLPFSIIISTLSFYYSADIMHLLYKNAGSYDAQVFTWVMMAFPAYAMMYTYSTLLTANRNIGLMNAISLLGVILSLGINFYIIPQQKALGAAITSCITQTVLALCYIYYSHKKLQLSANGKWLAAHFGFLVTIVVIGYVMKLSGINWMMQLLLTGTAGIMLMLLFRFVSIQSLKMLANKEN